MSLEDFQILDNEPIDNSIVKRDFLKVYQQQGAQIKQSNQNIDSIFGEKSYYHQIGNAYLEFHITVRKKDTTSCHYADPIRLVNIAFAFCFKEVRLSTTFGNDIEHNILCGKISTFMKVISNEDGDLLSQFDNINGNVIPVRERMADLLPQFRDTPHQRA